MDDIVVRGIVLSASLYGEYDKRLVVLSDELGKITVFANGARREKSPLKAVAQSFTMARFRLRCGRNAYTLISAEIEESFRELALDMEKMCYAAYFCELMEYFAQTGVAAGPELNLLYISFLALIDDRYDNRQIKMAFCLKLLDIEGVGLHMGDCVLCSSKEDVCLSIFFLLPVEMRYRPSSVLISLLDTISPNMDVNNSLSAIAPFVSF